MSMFAGITWLALKTQVKVAEIDSDLIGLPAGEPQKTVIVQIADAVFHHSSIPVLVIAIATATILALAANTAFNGFPVLGSILAADGFMPRQLKNRGDRLAFSNGILVLAGLAAALVVIYDADVSKIIQLYIVGVFVSFTFSQFGMIRHWTRHLREEADSRQRLVMKRNRVINSIGFAMTGTVLVIVLVTKFTHGAWIVCIAMPLLYGLMYAIHRHYQAVERAMFTPADTKVTLPSRVHAVVLVARIDAPTLRALRYAQGQRPTTLEAVHIDVEGGGARELAAEWERRDLDVPLRLVASPYREVTRPVVEYVAGLRRSSPRDLVLVYIPAYRPTRWWEPLLHHQSGLRLSNRLHDLPGVMIASVPQMATRSESMSADSSAPSV
jgi:hypothetical protein